MVVVEVVLCCFVVFFFFVFFFFFCCSFFFCFVFFVVVLLILYLMLQGNINIYSSDVALSYLFNPLLKSGLYGIKLFPFRAEPFHKELGMYESNQEVTKSYLPCKQCQKTYQVYPVLLIALFPI